MRALLCWQQLCTQLPTTRRSFAMASTLDKERFKEYISTLAVRVHKQRTSDLTNTLKQNLLKLRGLRPVVFDPTDANMRLVLLQHEIQDISDLPDDKRQLIEEVGEGVVAHAVEFGYDNMTAEQVLRKLIPKDLEVQTSFESMGHVAHINLREPLLPYKHLIAQVLLDKNPGTRTVVNKIGSISSEFRTFPLEVLVGDSDLNVEMKEHGVRFQFNVADVYWNSRLQEEHFKLVERFKENDVIADACCGIGPFAIPAAKRKGCTVYANDLNPKSYESLSRNIVLNKVEHKVFAFNQDARAFLKNILGGPRSQPVTQIVMNLPATALEFLDVFQGLFNRGVWSVGAGTGPQLPMVHCYCFSNALDPSDDIITRAETALGCRFSDVDRKAVSVREVRDVAPNKQMYCFHFRVPDYIGICPTEASVDTEAEEPAAKKARSNVQTTAEVTDYKL